MELIGPYLMASALLVVAGTLKVLRPSDTATALAETLPLARSKLRILVQIGAAGELAIGVSAILWPRPITAGAVAASYFGFSLFVWVQRRRGGPLSSCGCFGKPDTPATASHGVLTLLLAASSAVVAVSVRADDTIGALLTSQPGHGLPLAALSTVGAWLCFLALARLPQLTAIRAAMARDQQPR